MSVRSEEKLTQAVSRYQQLSRPCPAEDVNENEGPLAAGAVALVLDKPHEHSALGYDFVGKPAALLGELGSDDYRDSERVAAVFVEELGQKSALAVSAAKVGARSQVEQGGTGPVEQGVAAEVERTEPPEASSWPGARRRKVETLHVIEEVR